MSQNGAAERLIQGIAKLMMVFLLACELPFSLWAEAIYHANWLRNLLPASRVIHESPIRALVWNAA